MNKLSKTSVLILLILGLVLITGCVAPPSVARPSDESERSEGGQDEAEIPQDSTEDRKIVK